MGFCEFVATSKSEGSGLGTGAQGFFGFNSLRQSVRFKCRNGLDCKEKFFFWL